MLKDKVFELSQKFSGTTHGSSDYDKDTVFVRGSNGNCFPIDGSIIIGKVYIENDIIIQNNTNFIPMNNMPSSYLPYLPLANQYITAQPLPPPSYNLGNQYI